MATISFNLKLQCSPSAQDARHANLATPGTTRQTGKIIFAFDSHIIREDYKLINITLRSLRAE